MAPLITIKSCFVGSSMGGSVCVAVVVLAVLLAFRRRGGGARRGQIALADDEGPVPWLALEPFSL